MKIIPVVTPGEIALTSSIAREIWAEHYTPLIGAAQVEYMLERFQSPEAIRRAIADDGYAYYLLYDGGAERPAAYCGVRAAASELFVGKLYVGRAYRGRGFARAMLDRALADAPGVKKIWLTVNKGNAGSIAAYKRLGFAVEEGITTDIGNGFVMDDYKMVKNL